jgi:4a-hydroxytetrahydrobiopterin dehydratase
MSGEGLAQRECVPCRGGVPPLSDAQIAPLLEQLSPEWSVEERADPKHRYVKVLMRNYRFSNFAGALDAANRVGALAERQHHHPDLHVAWGRLGVEIWTHKIGGLTESDFIFAAKCDALLDAGAEGATAKRS